MHLEIKEGGDKLGRGPLETAFQSEVDCPGGLDHTGSWVAQPLVLQFFTMSGKRSVPGVHVTHLSLLVESIKV